MTASKRKEGSLPARIGLTRVARRRAVVTDWGRKAFIGLFVAAVTVGPFTHTGLAAPGVPPCDVPGQLTPHPVNWYTIRPPQFPAGAPSISEFAVEPLVPERIYVTNGSVVMRTIDSGCHWSQSYALPAAGAGPTAANSRILEIEVSAPGVVYLPIQQRDPVAQPHVAISQDAGETWKLADGPPLGAVTGRVRDFDASLGNGSAAAMLVDLEHAVAGAGSVESQQVLFFTDRAGAVWEPRELWDKGAVIDSVGAGVTINAQPELGAISMNPLRPNEIWLYGEAGVYRTDSGSPLIPVDLGQISALDISLDGAAVYAYSKDGRTGHFSLDTGESFRKYSTGFVVDSVDASTNSPPFAALSGFGRVYYQVPALGPQRPQTFDVSPLDGRAVSDVQVGVVESATITSIYGRSSYGIEVTYQPTGDPVPANSSVSATLTEPPPLRGNNRLMPSSKEIVLRTGRSKTIPYELNLPAATTPLDVYFMIDISGSMGGTINGVRSAMQEIADRLAGSKIDARFGVGSFRAFGDPPAYERDRDIGPADQGLASALNGLVARGGGDETQMYALLQSVNTESEPGIPAKPMTFRPGSLRVAIEATDEPISQGGQHPSIPTVVEGLRKADVKMVGLAIQQPPLIGEHDYSRPPEPAGTLMEVAEGSKAVAPDGGVDCDGDSQPEIDTGEPIVCMIAPDEADDAGLMANAIVSVLEAVQDIQDLEVQVGPAIDAEASSDTVMSIEPEVLPRVDLKEPSFHTFDVTVHCPQVREKTVYPLSVSVDRRGGVLAQAALTLVCKPFPAEEEKKKPAPVVLPFFPITAIFPPPPRPPEPVAEPNPNPQPNPQQNPATQTGLVMEKQEQTQLALAYDHVREQSLARQMSSEQYSFTAERQSRIPPPGFIAAAAAMSLLFAYVMAVEKSKSVARALNRRRP